MAAIQDYATGKPVNDSKPEERVRQEYERTLVDAYGYRKDEIDIEVRIPRGSGYFDDRADIVIYHPGGGRDPASDILGIVETKRPDRTDGTDQLKSYMTATSAMWGVWTNEEDIAYFSRNPANARGQYLEDVGRARKDELRPFGREELKSSFRRILRTLYENTTISRREKLLRDQKREMAQSTVFGIDKETDLVKIAKAHMAIAGTDGAISSMTIRCTMRQISRTSPRAISSGMGISGNSIA